MKSTANIKPAATHTPEPWEHGDNGLIYGQCAEADAEAPVICDVIDDSAMQALGILSPVEQANARRIVAAVNACKGIPTAALDQGVVADMINALRLWASFADLDEFDRVARAALARATATCHRSSAEFP